MENLSTLFLGLNDWLRQAPEHYPLAVYGVLFALVFLESAFFPLGPFLPGDGLLLTVGLLIGAGNLSLLPAITLLIVGGFTGNWVAYALGARFGPALFRRHRWFRQEHYERSQRFYRRYGDWAMVVSRFLPVLRALVPFVAGLAGMDRSRFHRYSLLAVLIWVVSLLSLGYYLYRLPLLNRHLSLLVVGATVAFLLFAALAALRVVLRSRAASR